MKQDFYNFQQCLRDLISTRSWLFEIKVPYPADIPNYLDHCGYSSSSPPFLSLLGPFGTYHPNLLDEYKDFFLFTRPGTREGVIFESFFNLRNHFHMIVSWINCPETDSPMPRLACSPVIYSDSAEKVVQFMEHNDKFLLRPTEKRVGFL